MRALRRRRGWTQQQLADRVGISRSAISRIERGNGDTLTVRLLTRAAGALGARVSMRVLWQGEELDRLLDREHAALVEWLVRTLAAAAWTVEPEVTFRIGPERGSIDVLARHSATGHLLVVEVKSVVPDIQALLAGIDRKARVAPVVARERGWTARAVSRLLVLPNDRTARRRLAAHRATMDRALPARTVELRRWIARPDRAVAGVMFVSNVTHTGARHRVARPRKPAMHSAPVGW
jgi:transcriptional regulator with XRE-family HTH domain